MRALILSRPIRWRDQWGRDALHNAGIARLPLSVAAGAIAAGMGVCVATPRGEALLHRLLIGESILPHLDPLKADQVVDLGVDLSKPQRRRP